MSELMRCLSCGHVELGESDECPDCGASREYEWGPVATESGLDDEDRHVIQSIYISETCLGAQDSPEPETLEKENETL